MGMRSTFDVSAIFNFLFALLLFVCICGKNFVEDDKKFKSDLADYQSKYDQSKFESGDERAEEGAEGIEKNEDKERDVRLVLNLEEM